MQQRISIGIICLLCFGLYFSVQAQTPPTVVFYGVYVFEAKSNGEDVEFPLMPGDIALTTIEQVMETSQEYLDQLKSIYSYNHFHLLTTFGGGYMIGLGKEDWGAANHVFLGKTNHYFLFSVQSKSGPQNGLLPIRIEAQLDTNGWKNQSKQKFDLFQTLCSVKNRHPLIIGRQLPFQGEQKRALFVIVTSFFQTCTDKNKYEIITQDYQTLLKMTASNHDLGGRDLFDKINDYFKQHLDLETPQSFESLLPPPPPPPKKDIDTEPVFIPYDKAPTPIGGYKTLQKHIYYPEIARKSGIEGKVLVYVLIDERGNIEKTKVYQTLKGCEQAALYAIRKVKWEPAIKAGKPIKVWVMVPVEFRLK
jgi:TonB family protein